MWKDLSMREKAALMKVAVKNGIYGLEEIRNKFDEGGPKDLYTPRFNEEGRPILNIDDPRDVKWLREQQAKRGEQYHKEGMKEVRPLAMGLAALTAAPALTGVGISSLVQPLDIASVYLDPSDPLNWLPFGLDAISKVERFTPSRIRQGLYNNIMPGSYSASYAGSKREEIKNAAKDIISGNTTYEKPKWEEWLKRPETWKEFNWLDQPELASEIRKEAWKESLGLPHEEKYLIKTGAKDSKGHDIVHYNLKEIPVEHLLNFVENAYFRNVTPDYIGNTGGIVSARRKGNNFTLEDLWDIQPFLNANREGILPEQLKLKFANKIDTPEGKYPFKWEYKDWVPEWFKEFDPTEILGKGPFRNITTIKATPLNKAQRTYKEPLDKARKRIADIMYEEEIDFIPFEDMKPEEIIAAKKAAKDRADAFLKNAPDEEVMKYREVRPKTREELLKEYGPFYFKDDTSKSKSIAKSIDLNLLHFSKNDFKEAGLNDIFYNKYKLIQTNLSAGKDISQSDRAFINRMDLIVANTKKYPEILYEGTLEREELIKELISEESIKRFKNAGISEKDMEQFFKNLIDAINNTPIKTTSINNKTLKNNNAAAITSTSGVNSEGRTTSSILVGESAFRPQELLSDMTEHELLHAADFYDNLAINYNKGIPLKLSEEALEKYPEITKLKLNGKPYLLDDIEARTRAFGARQFLKDSGKTPEEAFNSWEDIPGKYDRARDFFRYYDKKTGINFLNTSLGAIPFIFQLPKSNKNKKK